MHTQTKGNRSGRWGVFYRIDFDGKGGFKMGRGAAGYTTAYFWSQSEAETFAASIPAASRVPNHGAWEERLKIDLP